MRRLRQVLLCCVWADQVIGKNKYSNFSYAANSPLCVSFIWHKTVLMPYPYVSFENMLWCGWIYGCRKIARKTIPSKKFTIYLHLVRMLFENKKCKKLRKIHGKNQGKYICRMKSVIKNIA